MTGTVVPAQLPPEVEKTLNQALHQEQIEKGYQWILEKTSDEHNPKELLDRYLKRYEDQIMRLKGDVLEDYLPVFRAALAGRCLKMLPYFRMGFANKGFNPLFLTTYLQRKMLQAILGVSPKDVELKIRLSGRTPKLYLNSALEELLPQTCLARIL
ncbi:MAG: hypothetical protein ACLFUS_08655 [Candidatus Sumerlaeia bacterium]